MRLSWCGALASGKVKAYKVDQSTNGGSSYKSLLKATKATLTTRRLGPSTRYRWRAQTTDTRARKGSYRTSLVARLARVEDSSASVVYGGSWLTHPTSSVSGGTEHYTTTAGASATVTVGTTARAFAIVRSAQFHPRLVPGPRCRRRRRCDRQREGQRRADALQFFPVHAQPDALARGRSSPSPRAATAAWTSTRS